MVDQGTWLNRTVHIVQTRIWHREQVARERTLTDLDAPGRVVGVFPGGKRVH